MNIINQLTQKLMVFEQVCNEKLVALSEFKRIDAQCMEASIGMDNEEDYYRHLEREKALFKKSTKLKKAMVFFITGVLSIVLAKTLVPSALTQIHYMILGLATGGISMSQYVRNAKRIEEGMDFELEESKSRIGVLKSEYQRLCEERDHKFRILNEKDQYVKQVESRLKQLEDEKQGVMLPVLEEPSKDKQYVLSLNK